MKNIADTADAIEGGRDALGVTSGRMVAVARLGIGLAQGILLYLLMRTTEGDGPTWSSRNPELFAAMLLPTLFLPPVLLAGVGRLRVVTLAAWAGVAGVVLAGLAWHDIARQSGMDREPTFPLFVFSAVALFVAHHLILPADRERRLIASFPAYFDAAWMAGVQLAASVAFAGVFWLLLFLGAALFKVIGLNFLGDLLQQGWFFLPLTGLAFATAVHLTDVRDGLIRGVRTIALMLLSWLLLVLTVLVGAFLIALPFTGLSGLWETGSATALVLSAVGVMIVLINAAYQDGRPENLPPAVLRVAVQVASVLLVPLVGIAVWGLALRIGQHGLTPDRIIAMACAVIGALHAGGYAYAAAATLRPGSRWMAPLERTNIIGAVASVLAILALFSPVADPDRLSVTDQMGRLERGQVAADAFDYDFLQNASGKTGHAALARLVASEDPVIAARAKAAQNQIVLNDPGEAQDVRPVIATLDGAPALPEPFFEIVGGDEDARSECRAPGDCLAVLGPSLGFPQGDVLLVQAGTITVFSEDAEYGTYWSRGHFVPVVCEGRSAVDARDLLRQGRLRAADPSRPALETGSGVPAELVASARPRC